MNINTDLDLYNRRMAETIAWCNFRANLTDPENSLRTNSLRPGNIVKDKDGFEDFFWGSETENRAVLDILAEERAELLELYGIEPLPVLSDEANNSNGRLLLCEPNDSMHDGLANDWTRGFFDYEDVPAWDTWVWAFETPPSPARSYARPCLLCWVSLLYVELAGAGMDVNMLQMITWADTQAIYHSFLQDISRVCQLGRRLLSKGWSALGTSVYSESYFSTVLELFFLSHRVSL